MALAFSLAVLAPAWADGDPIAKDAGRRAPSWTKPHREADPRGLARPGRRVMGGPGYAGSDWGLGKPSFWGLGPRPDDGWVEY